MVVDNGLFRGWSEVGLIDRLLPGRGDGDGDGGDVSYL